MVACLGKRRVFRFSNRVVPRLLLLRRSHKNGPANSDGKPLKFKRPVVTRDQQGRAK
jgi:hypothetical protein